MADHEIRVVTGADLSPFLADLARLRVTVFRDYPYLYEGSQAYEEAYLRNLAQSPESVVVLVLAEGQVVGASTGLPLADEPDDFQAPFRGAGYDVARVFYCSESVLLKPYRGRGIYKSFFAGREDHARRLARFDVICFCGVQRPENHPLRPTDYVPLDAVWRGFGYAPRPELQMTLDWKDLDQPAKTAHPMLFWTKSLQERQAS